MIEGYRQEVFNVLLAQLLQERGVISAPESVLSVSSKKLRRLPDVVVDFHGLRTVIEGEVSDQPNADKKALDAARRRVEEGIAHIAIAVIYPATLRTQKYTTLKSKLSRSDLKISIITESEDTGFIDGNIDFLEGALRRAFDKLVQEDVVAQAVATIEDGIDKFAGVVIHKGGIMGRAARILGIRELPSKKDKPEEISE